MNRGGADYFPVIPFTDSEISAKQEKMGGADIADKSKGVGFFSEYKYVLIIFAVIVVLSVVIFYLYVKLSDPKKKPQKVQEQAKQLNKDEIKRLRRFRENSARMRPRTKAAKRPDGDSKHVSFANPPVSRVEELPDEDPPSSSEAFPRHNQRSHVSVQVENPPSSSEVPPPEPSSSEAAESNETMIEMDEEGQTGTLTDEEATKELENIGGRESDTTVEDLIESIS